MTCFDEDPSPESFPCAVEGCLGDVISDKKWGVDMQHL